MKKARPHPDSLPPGEEKYLAVLSRNGRPFEHDAERAVIVRGIPEGSTDARKRFLLRGGEGQDEGESKLLI